MAMLAVGVLWGAFLVDYATVRDSVFRDGDWPRVGGDSIPVAVAVGAVP